MSAQPLAASQSQQISCEVCILAGGLSSRMGRDKSRLRFGTKTLLGHIRAVAKETHLPMRVIRRDLVPRCGPLGGIYTALKTTRAEAVLFLACDMPFASSEFLRNVLKGFTPKTNALFSFDGDTAGFPFVLRRSMLEVVEAQLAKKSFSLQELARACGARMLRPSTRKRELLNLNTPAEWDLARQLFRKKT